MATTIKLKNSVTTTNAPSSLAQGEVAINVTDKKVWVGNAATTPVQLLGTGSDGSFTNLTVSGGAGFYLQNTNNSAFSHIKNSGGAAVAQLEFYTRNAERMRIDSNGGLSIGKTQPSEATGSGNGFGFASTSLDPFFSVVNVATAGGNACIYLNRRNISGTNYLQWFYTNNGTSSTTVGTISHNGTNTTYSTSSDYRLKENIAPMIGALTKVTQLKPCTYIWKSTGANGQGFIAHELQEVFPDAVTGEKDAVDKDGNIIPQGIDTSYLVATLTAAIQEQQAIITDLKARIETLESK